MGGEEEEGRAVPGPRSLTPPTPPAAGSLVQDLIRLLGEGRRLTRAALHLLLVPHLQELSLRSCPSLVSNAIGQLVTVRCKVSGQGGGRSPSVGLSTGVWVWGLREGAGGSGSLPPGPGSVPHISRSRCRGADAALSEAGCETTRLAGGTGWVLQPP